MTPMLQQYGEALRDRQRPPIQGNDPFVSLPLRFLFRESPGLADEMAGFHPAKFLARPTAGLPQGFQHVTKRVRFPDFRQKGGVLLGRYPDLAGLGRGLSSAFDRGRLRNVPLFDRPVEGSLDGPNGGVA